MQSGDITDADVNPCEAVSRGGARYNLEKAWLVRRDLDRQHSNFGYSRLFHKVNSKVKRCSFDVIMTMKRVRRSNLCRASLMSFVNGGHAAARNSIRADLPGRSKLEFSSYPWSEKLGAGHSFEPCIRISMGDLRRHDLDQSAWRSDDNSAQMSALLKQERPRERHVRQASAAR